MITPKFVHNRTHFHQDLKKRVHQYFLDKNKPSTGNLNLHFKAFLFFFSYVALYIHLVYFTPPIWLALIECVLLGLFTAAIGFNIMHDGGHGSFSRNKIFNKMAAFSVNFVGASGIMWNMKHNIIHHTYTNIDGVDDDIEIKPYLRMCRSQPHRFLHRFQHFYFWFLYTFLHILWIFVSDYQKYFSRKIGVIPIKKMSIREHFNFWIAKVVYLIMYMVIPIYILGFTKWAIGFLITSMVTGFVISMVFQLAHTVEETEFPEIDANTHHIENEWALHQINTTANFATNSKLISWLVGGLNFQVEHHLFPKVSHVHYPAINKIVKQTCKDYGLHYLENPTLGKAIISHVHHLKTMGRAS